jgi:hypothetical protein
MHAQLASRHPDVIIAQLAARQHGVVAWWQLRAAGITRGELEVRIATGRLHRLHQGVYAVGHTALTREGRRLAAVLASGPAAVLSHRSAAEHWLMLPPTGRAFHVTVPGLSGRARRPGLRVHHADVERVVHAGVPVTTVARTILDVAATEPATVLARCIQGAEHERLFDLAALEPLMTPGRRGVGALRRAIEAWSDAPTRSELERAFLELCLRHGIPRPLVNAQIEGFEVDFAWRAQRLIVETDGSWHATRRALESDRDRDLVHALAGYRTLRFTWRQVTRDSARVASLVRRTFE